MDKKLSFTLLFVLLSIKLTKVQVTAKQCKSTAYGILYELIRAK